jgi:anti-sigma B factor antagonist
MSDSAPSESGIRYVDGVMIIEPPNELMDRLEIVNIGDAWLKAIETEQPTRVVMNFDRVSFFGSEAIGVVIRMTKRIRTYGGDIKLCSMGKMIREIFDICQLIPALFEVYDSTADAIASFE